MKSSATNQMAQCSSFQQWSQSAVEVTDRLYQSSHSSTTALTSAAPTHSVFLALAQEQCSNTHEHQHSQHNVDINVTLMWHNTTSHKPCDKWYITIVTWRQPTKSSHFNNCRVHLHLQVARGCSEYVLCQSQSCPCLATVRKTADNDITWNQWHF